MRGFVFREKDNTITLLYLRNESTVSAFTQLSDYDQVYADLPYERADVVDNIDENEVTRHIMYRVVCGIGFGEGEDKKPVPAYEALRAAPPEIIKHMLDDAQAQGEPQ